MRAAAPMLLVSETRLRTRRSLCRALPPAIAWATLLRTLRRTMGGGLGRCIAPMRLPHDSMTWLPTGLHQLCVCLMLIFLPNWSISKSISCTLIFQDGCDVTGFAVRPSGLYRILISCFCVGLISKLLKPAHLLGYWGFVQPQPLPVAASPQVSVNVSAPASDQCAGGEKSLLVERDTLVVRVTACRETGGQRDGDTWTDTDRVARWLVPI